MRVRLEMLDRARREFIANASHELRTPLFSLAGFLELMADEEIDEATRQEFLETMREQVDRLAKLATDLLDLSRLDAGRMRVEHEPVDLGVVAQLVAEEFALVPSGRIIRSRWPSRPSDRAGRRAARAAGVSRAGRQRPGAHAAGDEGDAAGLRRPRARIPRSRGRRAGVPPEHAPHVFDRFYRAEGGVASGSGLGLAIARELVTFMDGSVELESEPGHTVVRVVLGAAPTSVAAPPVGERVST
jgi:signal transduction histidine kinase